MSNRQIARYNRVRQIRRKLKHGPDDPLDVAAEALYEKEQLRYDLEEAEGMVENLTSSLKEHDIPLPWNVSA